MRRPPSLRLALLLPLGLAAFACTNEASTEPGDPPADAGAPSALGNGFRIAQLNDPDSSVMPVNNQMNVTVTGATFLIQDTYSETGLASAVGPIYAEDFHAPGTPGLPWSGMELYKPTFEPASLALAPGDVVDFTGEYQSSYETYRSLEMYEPIITFRFDYSPPTPTVINISDLDGAAAQGNLGYQWLNMLVTVEDTVGGIWVPGTTRGKCFVFLTSDQGMTGVAMDNELFDLPCSSPMYNTTQDGGTVGAVHFKSVTGIVTNDVNFRISPRSAADIVLAD